MIPFEFTYLKPDTLQEAVQAYREFALAGRSPLYYSGGSEIITMCRTGTIRPGAVIDLKGIPECGALSRGEDWLTLGAALTLNQIKESKAFPLLTLACGRIADHTNQCRITLGGNLCGTIRYREASLPLLLCDAQTVLLGPEGMKTLPFDSAFQGRMHLNPGEMVVQVQVPAWALTARCAHIKKNREREDRLPAGHRDGTVQGPDASGRVFGACAKPVAKPCGRGRPERPRRIPRSAGGKRRRAASASRAGRCRRFAGIPAFRCPKYAQGAFGGL